jgi:PAS domain S-box-containing protein
VNSGGFAEVMETVGKKKGDPDRCSDNVSNSLADRKKLEVALVASEIRYRGAFEFAMDGILILDAYTGMIVDVNPFLTNLLGFTREEFYGKKIWELGFFKDIVANEANFLELQQKCYVRYEDMPLETKDGRKIDVEFVSNVYEVGNLKIIQCIIRNITDRKKTEDALHEVKEVMERHSIELQRSLSYNRGLIEASVDPLVTIGLEGKIIDVNKATEEATGISRERLIGSDFASYFTSPAKAREVYQKVFAQESVRDYPLELKNVSGRVIHVLYNAVTFNDENGKVQGVFAAARDVTKRKKVEEALQKSQTLLNEMGKIAKVGGWEFDVETMEQMWTEEVYRIHEIDFSYKPVVSEGIKFYAPESRPIITEAVQRTIEMGEPFDLELEIITAKNNRIKVRAIGKAHMVNGKTVRVSGTFQDITEFKRIEEANRKIEEEQRIILDSIPAWVFYKDRDNRFIRVNNAFSEVMGLSREQLEGKSLWDFYPKEQADAFWRDDLAVIESGKPKTNIIEPMDSGGSTLWALTDKIPFRDSQGNIVGIIGFTIDITELKRAEDEVRNLNVLLNSKLAELEDLNRELESFAYSVSHDLRTPLRAIDGFSKIIAEDYEEKLDDEGKRLLGEVRIYTHKMGKLIDDLLAFSRIGRQELTTTRIEMKNIVTKAMLDLDKEASGRNIQLLVGDMPAALGDRLLLSQVMINLLSNAIKFTKNKESAQIEVSGRQEGNEIIYSVKDNGAGFDMKYVDKLFGVFQRLHSADDFEGTGVGLAIVQRIIHKHGGRVWAEGKINEGATFFFALPNSNKKYEMEGIK